MVTKERSPRKGRIWHAHAPLHSVAVACFLLGKHGHTPSICTHRGGRGGAPHLPLKLYVLALLAPPSLNVPRPARPCYPALSLADLGANQVPLFVSANAQLAQLAECCLRTLRLQSPVLRIGTSPRAEYLPHVNTVPTIEPAPSKYCTSARQNRICFGRHGMSQPLLVCRPCNCGYFTPKHLRKLARTICSILVICIGSTTALIIVSRAERQTSSY